MKARKPKRKRGVIMYYVAFRFDDVKVVDRKALQGEIIEALRAAALDQKLGSAEFIVGFDPNA